MFRAISENLIPGGAARKEQRLQSEREQREQQAHNAICERARQALAQTIQPRSVKELTAELNRGRLATYNLGDLAMCDYRDVQNFAASPDGYLNNPNNPEQRGPKFSINRNLDNDLVRVLVALETNGFGENQIKVNDQEETSITQFLDAINVRRELYTRAPREPDPKPYTGPNPSNIYELSVAIASPEPHSRGTHIDLGTIEQKEQGTVSFKPADMASYEFSIGAASRNGATRGQLRLLKSLAAAGLGMSEIYYASNVAITVDELIDKLERNLNSAENSDTKKTEPVKKVDMDSYGISPDGTTLYLSSTDLGRLDPGSKRYLGRERLNQILTIDTTSIENGATISLLSKALEADIDLPPNLQTLAVKVTKVDMDHDTITQLDNAMNVYTTGDGSNLREKPGLAADVDMDCMVQYMSKYPETISMENAQSISRSLTGDERVEILQNLADNNDSTAHFPSAEILRELARGLGIENKQAAREALMLIERKRSGSTEVPVSSPVTSRDVDITINPDGSETISAKTESVADPELTFSYTDPSPAQSDDQSIDIGLNESMITGPEAGDIHEITIDYNGISDSQYDAVEAALAKLKTPTETGEIGSFADFKSEIKSAGFELKELLGVETQDIGRRVADQILSEAQFDINRSKSTQAKVLANNALTAARHLLTNPSGIDDTLGAVWDNDKKYQLVWHTAKGQPSYKNFIDAILAQVKANIPNLRDALAKALPKAAYDEFVTKFTDNGVVA